MIPENSNNIDSSNCPLWRVKYRPSKISQIKQSNPALFQQISGFIRSKNIPHLMLIGPKGSGKTTLAEIIARELLGKEFEINSKILFADDPIGKEERNETKRQGRISTKKVGSGAGSQKNFRPFIQVRVRPFVSSQKFGDSPFKILIIKNFHTLDIEQQAFRRIMEQYSKNCRMILITDRVSAVIDPIISRCQLLMIPYVPEFKFNKLIKDVCDFEKIPIKLDTINYVRHMSGNNVGKALDLLQLTHLKYKFLNLDNLSKVFSSVSERGIINLINSTFQGKFKPLRGKLREIYKEQNLSKNEILLEMSRKIASMPLERDVQAFYLDLIAKTDFESLDSSSDEIQMSNLLSKMSLIGKIN
ncbi:MAG: AAA family ATPase [Promethearchaeota archaeon]